MSVAADHVEDVVVGCVDAKRVRIVPDGRRHPRPKPLAEQMFGGHDVPGGVAVAHDTPADDLAGGSRLKCSFAAVSANRFLAKRAIAILVDGEMPFGDSATADSERTMAVVELGGHVPLMPFAAAVAEASAPIP